MVSNRKISERRAPTLRQVAEVAGVSPATVSYVLNGRGGVSAETAERVLAHVEQLGYRPNITASGLRTGRSRVIGLVLADIANPFYPELAAGIIESGRRSGYQVFVSHSGADEEHHAQQVGALVDHSCEGLILTTVTERDRSALTRLTDQGLPVVQLIRRISDLPADFVGGRERAGAREAAVHLAQLGHVDIAVLAGPQASSASRERVVGWRAGLAEHGVEIAEHRFLEASLTREGGVEGMRELLDRDRGRLPTALLAGNDVMALGAIDRLWEEGLDVPRDVAVVGYDDMSFASARPFSLTTVHQPLRRLGEAAVDVLLVRIREPDAPPRQVLLPQHLAVRDSCGASLQTEAEGARG